jgi:hypothetical protein
MLYGNSSIGKTELVREIAKNFFGNQLLEQHLSMFKSNANGDYLFGDKPNRRSIGFDLLEREIGILEFTVDSPVKEIFAISGEKVMNCIAETENGCVCTIELATTLSNDCNPVDKHEIITDNGVGCDRVVDTQVPQQSIYVFGEDKKFFTDTDAEFDWNGEYVTDFEKYNLGRGEGRNHDAFMWNEDVVVGIEGKADESLGSQLIGEAIVGASDNKMHRVRGMIKMLFDDIPENHQNIRYQLVTATTATLLEAKERNVNTAILLVSVFKKEGCFSAQKIADNNADIQRFLSDIKAEKCGEYYVIPTAFGKENNIQLYFKKIEFTLD